MQKFSSLFLSLSLLATFAAGCTTNSGLNTTPAQDFATAPAIPDMSMPKPIPDLAVPPMPDLSVIPIIHDMAQFIPVDAGPMCGNTYCNTGDECCVSGTLMNLQFACAKSCADGGLFALECTGPEGCGGNACCVTLGAAKGGGFMASNAQCKPLQDCTPVININTRGATTRFCHQDADCGGQLNNCCTANLGMSSIHVCFDPNFAGFTMGLVTCP